MERAQLSSQPSIRRRTFDIGYMIQQDEQARDEAMTKARFLQQLIEEREKNAINFSWIQSHQTMEMEENLSLQNQLKVARITTDSLKKKINDYSDEISSLHSKSTLVEVCMGATENQLHHAQSKPYKAIFEDCRLLVAQILLEVRACLLRVFIMIGYMVSSCKPSKS